MPSFVQLYNDNEDIFNEEATVQVRVNVDDEKALDAFKQEKVKTDLYVVFHLGGRHGPTYQLSADTTLSDADQYQLSSSCHQCGSSKEILESEVWFRSSSSNKTFFLCTDCAEKLVEREQQVISQVPDSKIVNLTI